MNNIKNRWFKALNSIWALNRVHVSSEMSYGYKLLKNYYDNIKIFGYKTGQNLTKDSVKYSAQARYYTVKR